MRFNGNKPQVLSPVTHRLVAFRRWAELVTIGVVGQDCDANHDLGGIHRIAPPVVYGPSFFTRQVVEKCGKCGTSVNLIIDDHD